MLSAALAEGWTCLAAETNPKPLRVPIPYRGQLGLFDVSDEFIRDPAGYILYTQN